MIFNPEYNDYHRTIALTSLFARHLKTGAPLGSLESDLGIGRLFTEDTVQNATVFSKKPFQVKIGEGAWLVSLDFMSAVHQSLYLRISGSGLSRRDFLNIAQSGDTNREARILEFVFAKRKDF